MFTRTHKKHKEFGKEVELEMLPNAREEKGIAPKKEAPKKAEKKEVKAEVKEEGKTEVPAEVKEEVKEEAKAE